LPKFGFYEKRNHAHFLYSRFQFFFGANALPCPIFDFVCVVDADA
jgi:hypothetical protein